MSYEVPVTAVPTTIPDHNEDTEFWWDSYVTQFPSNYYSLLSPTDYFELFGDDEEEAEDMIYKDEEAEDMIYKDEEADELLIKYEEAEELINKDMEAEELINKDKEAEELINKDEEVTTDDAAKQYDATTEDNATTQYDAATGNDVAAEHDTTHYDAATGNDVAAEHDTAKYHHHLATTEYNHDQATDSNSVLWQREVKERLTTPNSYYSCGLAKKKRLQGKKRKKKGDTTPLSSTFVLAPAAA